MRRAGWVVAVVVLGMPALHALDVEVGSSFKISGIVRQEDNIILPSVRNKYHPVRILDQDTYRFVSACGEPCMQPAATLEPHVVQVRSVRSQEDVRLVSVRFNQAWLITFWVRKDGGIWRVEPPEPVVFLESALWQQTRKQILQALSQETI